MQSFWRRGFGVAAVNKNLSRGPVVNASSVNNVEATQKLKSWKEIPGPPSLPLIGHFLNFLPGGVLYGLKGTKVSEKLHKQYGPIVRLNGFLNTAHTIVLFDADAVEHILRSENTMPIRPGFASLDYYRKRYNKTYDPTRKSGLVTDHGETWRDFRSKVNHILLQPKIIKLYRDVLAEVADDMVARIRLIRDENNMIKKNFDAEMNLWALESIAVVALGARLNCFDPNLPEDSPARKLVQNIHDFFDIAEKLDSKPSPWKYFSTPNFKKAMKIYQEQESLAKIFIYEAMKNIKESKKNGSHASDSEKPVLEKLLEIDDHMALIMASDMLVAGVDTIAHTALATFYLLAKNPEKQNKLREEIMAKQSRHPYLRACIKESMRILPVVNGNVRTSTKEYNLMGYKIPKDMMIIFPHQYMSKMAEHYPNPEEFIPERWITEKDDPLYHGNAHPFANSPFGFGVRMCIGRRIAELEMEILITKFVENFQLEWEGAPINITPTMLNYVSEPFNFIFKDL